MVVRVEAIQARLLKLDEVNAHLQALRELPEQELLTEFKNRWALERGLQLGAEVLLDIGNHVLSSHFGSAAADYEDILRQLGLQGVIPEELATRLSGMGGFRNILVHAYLDLDPRQVLRHLEHAPEDFDAFADALRRWLREQGLSA